MSNGARVKCGSRQKGTFEKQQRSLGVKGWVSKAGCQRLAVKNWWVKNWVSKAPGAISMGLLAVLLLSFWRLGG